MRDFAKISPTFWTGTTGKALRRRGSEALVVAMYLMSSPHSNMLGMYYQPVLYMAHETGLGIEGASKGLQSCIEEGFCCFDEATEMLWVKEMACYQIGSALKSTDKRCAGIQKEYDALPNCPFLGAFFDRYQADFHLKRKREDTPSSEAPYQAPSEPHRSKEKEKEKEKERENARGFEGDGLGLDFVLPDWVPKKSWDGYVEMRKRIRKPMTDRARELKVAELLKFRQQGFDVGSILDKSTSNSWTDIYPPKPGELEQHGAAETVNRV